MNQLLLFLLPSNASRLHGWLRLYKTGERAAAENMVTPATNGITKDLGARNVTWKTQEFPTISCSDLMQYIAIFQRP
jgi:hypothetical protein